MIALLYYLLFGMWLIALDSMIDRMQLNQHLFRWVSLCLALPHMPNSVFSVIPLCTLLLCFVWMLVLRNKQDTALILQCYSITRSILTSKRPVNIADCATKPKRVRRGMTIMIKLTILKCHDGGERVNAVALSPSLAQSSVTTVLKMSTRLKRQKRCLVIVNQLWRWRYCWNCELTITLAAVWQSEPLLSLWRPCLSGKILSSETMW